MALHPYNPADGLFIINGIPITDWGETQPALVIADMMPRKQMKPGMGGGAASMKPITTPKRVTINLLPGSDQARFLVGQMKSDVTIQASWIQTGSVEAEVFVDGIIVQRGDRGRIANDANSLSDEQFVIEFRDSTET